MTAPTGPRRRRRRWVRDWAIAALVLAALLPVALLSQGRDDARAQRTVTAVVDGSMPRVVEPDRQASLLRRTSSVHVSDEVVVVVVAQRGLRRSTSCRLSIALPGRDPYLVYSRVGGCSATSALMEDGTLHPRFVR